MMEISAAVAVSTAISLSWSEISKVSSIRSSLTTVAEACVFIVLAGAELLFVPRPGPATRFPAARVCLSTGDIKISSSTGR